MDRVYVETSVWGMVPPGQNPALRQPTLEFLEKCARQVYVACISDVVANEIRQAPAETQEAILQWLSELNPVLLPLPPEADALAQRFIDEVSCPLVAWMMLVMLLVPWLTKWNCW